MVQKLTLIRGIPGSGKSTKAKELVANSPVKMSHYEADMFFINEAGEYLFNREYLGDAHDWCYGNTAKDLSDDISVVVSNTFTKLWEMEKYIALANKLGAELEVIECTGRFQNIHGAPESVVQSMLDRFERFE